MKDLTKGKPTKVIIMFAIPLLCGYIFQQLYNMADSKIVSFYVSTEAFGAIGATAVISNTIMSFINGMTQGFAIPIANSFGAKDYDRLRKYVAGTISLTAILAVVFSVVSQLVIENILDVLNTPPEIIDDALSYVRIILAGIAFSSLYNMCANTLRAVGDSKTPLYCLMASVVINIGLDLLFVSGFGMGIKGAAYATIISQAFSGLACVTFILCKFRTILPKKESWKFDFGFYKELLTTGLAMGLMSCIVNVGSIVLQSAINGLGTDIVSAHTAARRVFDILTVMLYSTAVAMTTYVSQNIGAGRADRVRAGVRQALIIDTIIAAVLFVVCFLFARPLLTWIASTDNPDIIDSAVMYSRISICFFFVLGPLLILRMSLQGLGRKIIPVFTSILEMLVKILSATFLVPRFKYVGVAFTEPISWVIMTIVLAVAYFGNLPKDEKNDADIQSAPVN